MKRGKFEAPRTRRVHPLFWIILIVFLILGTAVLLKTCAQSGKDSNAEPSYPVSDSQQTQPSVDTTTAPTTAPVTEPTTAPTEPATEPTTVPTEPPTVPEETVPTEPDISLGLRVVEVARTAIGKPYQKGGAGPDGFETSGLISYCFKECGISVPRRTSAQFAAGEAVEKENLLPGDVVFFYMETPGSADYMGIYTGENTFITVSSSAGVVIERKLNSSYYKEHYVDARRYITE